MAAWSVGDTLLLHTHTERDKRKERKERKRGGGAHSALHDETSKRFPVSGYQKSRLID